MLVMRIVHVPIPPLRVDVSHSRPKGGTSVRTRAPNGMPAAPANHGHEAASVALRASADMRSNASSAASRSGYSVRS